MNEDHSDTRWYCEKIYEHVKDPNGMVNSDKFLADLEALGILHDDPRIASMIQGFNNNETMLTVGVFIECIKSCATVIEHALTNSGFEDFSCILRNMFFSCKANKRGSLTNFIPQLRKQNPDHWGVSVCTTSGQRLNLGASSVPFSVQSCCKPIAYCMALEEYGVEKVHQYVGREPSGIKRNALKLSNAGLPHNPLVNAGAIMICSLIKNHLCAADRFDYVVDKWKKASGGKAVGYNNSVYLSEKRTGDRDFALSYFMKENKLFPLEADMSDVVEFYYQMCSITTTSNLLSIVAATLANGGVCPLTGEVVFTPAAVKNCLSMMYSCGMYDYSGEFAFNVGLPAKSGDSGGLFVVIPNVMGICTFSPLLDKYGNSARGVEFCRKLTEHFSFHLFDIDVTNGLKQNPIKAEDDDDVTVEKIIRYSSIGDISALRRLRVKNTNLAVGDYDKRTPLHLAASNGHLDVVKFISATGVVTDINPIDRWNGTPYDDAVREGFQEVADYLRSLGGKSGSDIIPI